MNERPKLRWGCLQWGIVVGVGLLSGFWIVPTFSNISKIGNVTWGVSCCKQVVLGMKQFSKDNDGWYADGGQSATGLASANQVFRRLFQAGVMEEECVFGCPGSRFVPDGHIGTAPDFKEALEPGECHWIWLKHQKDSSAGNIPVIVENALETGFPPRWDVSEQAGIRKGRARKGRQIIVGRNDGSVQVEKLGENGSVELWSREFTPGQITQLSYWDIEEK